MKMLTVVELEWQIREQAWEEMQDYTFVNPDHVLFIQSVPFPMLTWDEDEKRRKGITRYGYKIFLANNMTLNVIALDRELFYSTLTGA